MENEPQKTDRQLLEEIHDSSRKTQNYMKWQLIITVALVVIPLLGMLILIPFAMRSVTSLYSAYGLDQVQGSQVQDLIQQYTK